MPDQPNPNTIYALEQVMQEIQNLVDHPRIQQRTWVARGKEWLPILQIVHGELIGKRVNPSTDETSVMPENESASILVEVNAGHAQTFINVALTDVQQIEVYRGGEPGYRSVRGAHSGFMLKDGRKYLTGADEAQRILDAMRKRDEAAGGEQK